MITHKQQRPAFYLLFLALICCINKPLQAMKQNKNKPTISDNKCFTFACCINKKLHVMERDKNLSTLFYGNKNDDWINDNWIEKDRAWIKKYIENTINDTLKKKNRNKKTYQSTINSKKNTHIVL